MSPQYRTYVDHFSAILEIAGDGRATNGHRLPALEFLVGLVHNGQVLEALTDCKTARPLFAPVIDAILARVT